VDRRRLTPRTVLVLEKGDLTKARVDAIVNAANEGLLGGGGVDGAIHRAAGPRLLDACRALPQSAGVRCPTGEARITPGFELAAPFVIHAVGPIYDEEKAPEKLLASAHRHALELARKHALKSIAFPAISCGVYGYPLEEAAPIALAACEEHAGELEEVRFVLFSENVLEAWRRAAERFPLVK
jgi:O-acetyl-ADP-ribose deacetylase (regulator of RNase III)